MAEDLDLPLRGVNLPNHFVLAYLEEDSVGGGSGLQQNILFYVNPFSQGDILGRNEIDEFLMKLQIAPQEGFYQPCTNRDIVRRQLNNLHHSYVKQGDAERAEELDRLRRLLGPMPDEPRRLDP
ncbi:MAG: hypothetical protein IPJ87_06105 [Flavobacteriales bacterium]|nr:hypothetical protein [Flavobacteriales bacterium]